jgi:hypothetical protein
MYTRRFNLHRITRVIGLIGLVTVTLTFGTAAAQTCHQFIVQLQGVVYDQQATTPFNTTQVAIVRDRGFMGNPIDFALLPFNNNLNAQAAVGDIELMTNTAWTQNAGVRAWRSDQAYVTMLDANTFSFQLDPGLITFPPAHVFVTTSAINTVEAGLGLLCPISHHFCHIGVPENLQTGFKVPHSGGGAFQVQGQQIVGQIDVLGVQVDNYGNQARYTADFSGLYQGAVQCP